MGEVIIHAGMPKTGTTSLQSWMETAVADLRDEHGIHLVSEAPAGDGSIELQPHRSGTVIPAGFLLTYWSLHLQGAPRSERVRLATDFADALDRAAAGLGTVVVTAENLAILLSMGDDVFLGALEQLAQRHTVRIAYYVRPQDEALESRWRQWGFLSDLPPSAWVLEDLRNLDYRETAATVAALAPSVHFDVRPFRRDLLEAGNVVVDFARNVLEVDAAPDDVALRENPGLPLDLAILLRDAPDEVVRPVMAAAAERDDAPAFELGIAQARLGQLAGDWSIPESEAAARSRAVLQRFTYETLEPGNQVLIEETSWPIDTFIDQPPPDAPSEPTIEELDRLWQLPAADTAQAYLHAALRELLRT